MYWSFFALAAQSPTRQKSFRVIVGIHLALLLIGVWLVAVPDPVPVAHYLGHVLMVAGIVEGALLIGWRLTQLPKSQGLEFLLVTSLEPPGVFVAEALVGLSRLALVTLSGFPVLVLLTAVGVIDPIGLVLLLVMPFTWGALTGLTLCVWAFELQTVRRWGERIMLGLILLWLGVGVLAGEHLRDWLFGLPPAWQFFAIGVLRDSVTRNPFAILWAWLKQDPWASSWEWTLGVEAAALVLCGLFFTRAAFRLKGHFHDRHYKPAADRGKGNRLSVGSAPLSWWAVKRVSEYSGRINLWLAGGVGVLYALYIMAGPHWPSWLGTQVFLLFDGWGGVPVVATGLVLLAAVPAAYQYGLWDSSATDRCKRLELLLLTDLNGVDYWEAAWAAAWRRGRGYFFVAGLLWFAACVGGRLSLAETLLTASLGVLLWGLYFALGFRAFARGVQANGLGMLLTLALPLAAFGLVWGGWTTVAALLPPGGVYAAAAHFAPLAVLPGAALAAGVTLIVGRLALAQCDGDLRRWYDKHHGRKIVD